MTHEKYPIFANTAHRATSCRGALAQLAYHSAFIVLIAIFLIHGGCSDRPEGAATQSISREDAPELQRLKIVCTTTMIEDLARILAADVADVQGLMRPGEDPHIYNVRPRDAEQIAQADLVLTNGYHLESTLDKVIKNNATGRVVALAELAVPEPLGSPSERDSGAPDPHCWMSVSNFQGYLQHARDALIAADPDHAVAYRNNARKYDAQLRELDQWIQAQLALIPAQQRVIVTSHDAFNYLADAYDIDVRAIVGISTAQSPRPQDIENIEAIIKDRDVRAVFVETSVSSTLNTLVKKSAAATGAKIGGTLYSDSLDEPGKPAGSYLGMMNHNVSTIVDALRGS